MGFRLGTENLPVTKALAGRLDLSGYSIIVLQHAVSDTVRLLHHLKHEAGATNIHFVAKPYSVKPRRIEAMTQEGVRVYSEKDYDSIEAPGYLERIIQEASKETKHHPLILEVGGCFARPLSNGQPKITGVVEVTTFGHNRYEASLGNIAVPIHSIAKSKIKEEEANHVGQAVTTSLEVLLKELGRDFSSGKVLMVGYGMIGKAVTTSLRGRGIQTGVYDSNSFRRHEATRRGFETDPNIEALLANVDMIISSTSEQGITAEIIQACPDGVILVSAGSRQNEIDMDFLRRHSSATTPFHKHMTRYIIGGKEIFVVREGKNVNFIGESCPDTCMDLIHAGVLSCVAKLIGEKNTEKKGIIHEPSPADIEEIYRLHEAFWHTKKPVHKTEIQEPLEDRDGQKRLF